MTFKEIALNMWPCWALGAYMLYATAKSQFKDLLRIEKKPLIKWSVFLLFLTVYRILTVKYLAETEMYKDALKNVAVIPWQATLTVFWEDACHTLPLVLLRRMLGTKWYMLPVHFLLLALVTLSFGSGHIYQGYIVSAFLMLYIPFTMKLGEKYGFGTIMAGHTLYDLSTILAIKWMLGF
jgi:hypothetical protein